MNIKDRLQAYLSKTEQQISILNEIRQRPHHLATEEDVKALSSVADSLEGGFSIEAIALMMEAKKRARLKKQNHYEPWLIKKNDRVIYIILSRVIADHIHKGDFFSYNCIIFGSSGHCSAVQIEFDGRCLYGFYVDSSGDLSNQDFFDQIFDGQTVETFISKRQLRIQQDSMSCALFGIQYLNNLSNRSLAERMSNFPAVYFKNTQRLSVLDGEDQSTFIDKKHMTVSLQGHIDKYSITFLDSTQGPNGIMRQHNYAIVYVRHKYLLSALAQLKALFDCGGAENVQKTIELRCTLMLTDEALQHYFLQIYRPESSNCRLRIGIYDIFRWIIEKDKPDIMSLFIVSDKYIIENPAYFRRWVENYLDERRALPNTSECTKYYPSLFEKIVDVFMSETYMRRHPIEFDAWAFICKKWIEKGLRMEKKDSSSTAYVKKHPFLFEIITQRMLSYDYIIGRAGFFGPWAFSCLSMDIDDPNTAEYAKTYGVIFEAVLYAFSLNQKSIHYCVGCIGHIEFRNKANHVLHKVLDDGFDVNACEEDGNTALHAAVTKEEIKILLEANAAVNSRNRDGCTPLDCCQKNEHTIREDLDEMTWLLVQADADISGENAKKFNLTHLREHFAIAFSNAIHNNDIDRAEYLMSVGNKIIGALHEAEIHTDLFEFHDKLVAYFSQRCAQPGLVDGGRHRLFKSPSYIIVQEEIDSMIDGMFKH